MLEEWLAAANLLQFHSAFREQQIQFGDLGDLTDDDLRELGMTIGERKRFHRALATSVATVVTAERRPLTLAFIDLVGSSALCEELDAEDMVELLRCYRERCSTAIDRFGGHIAHLMGDGILAYFCYPAAHENDAERAVRAAVEITDTVCRLHTPANRTLAVRCGIATGRVVVTELFTGRAADKHAVTGSTPNLAARLQTLAPANGIMLSHATWRRVSHVFDCEELGAHPLKGFAEPLPVFRVRQERQQPRAADELLGEALTPFVGRESQHAVLAEAWAGAGSGHGGTVVVYGDAGMGKSRLVARFLTATADRSTATLRLHASAFDEHSPLRPFLGYVRQQLNLTGAVEGSKLRTGLQRLMPRIDDAALDALARFVGTEAAPADGVGSDARDRRDMALEALADHFLEQSAGHPLLLVIEDAHWLDATSRELLARMTALAGERHLLLLLTSRLPLADVLPGVEATAVRELSVGALTPAEVQSMIRSTFGDEPIPQELVARIAERTDGVPLFVEELIRPLLRSSLPTSWARVVAEDSRPTAVPATLDEALMARLDGLGRAKEVAQVAAVLGRLVDLRTLARVIEQPAEKLAGRLETLCAAGILQRTADSDGKRYVFGHALVRDAAYASLLRDQRQRLHLRIADAILDVSPTFAAERPDVIARHLTEGGAVEAALPHWLAAGRAAAARSALHEARYVLEEGSAIAAKLPQTDEVVQTRLEFASLLGPVLFALCGPGSEESRAVYETAVALSETAPECASYFPVLWGWWRVSNDFRVKHDRAMMLMRLARRRDEPEMLLQAHHCNWASTFHAGDFDGCRVHVEAGLKTYESAAFDQKPWLYGNHDARVCAHGELAQVLWMQGEPLSALHHEQETFAFADKMSHAGTQAHAFDMAMLHRYYRCDIPATRDFADRMIAFAEDQGMTEPRARGHLFLGWTLAKQNEAEAGMKVFEHAYRRQREIGTNEDTPVYACMFAEILNHLGDHDRALHDLHEVRGELERLGIYNWQPELWRLIGETVLLRDPNASDIAREAFAASAKLGMRQRVVALQLRTAMSEARLLKDVDVDHVMARVRRLREQIVERDASLEVTLADRLLKRHAARPKAPAHRTRSVTVP